jgi:superoxide dismutase, Cu-Zn family
MKLQTLAAAASLALAACTHDGGHSAPAPATAAQPAPAPLAARANLIGTSGAIIGQVRMEQGRTGVLIRAEIAAGSLAPGWHGLHLHATGDCSDVGAFQLSGGHHGKADGAHGLMNPALGPEPGDLPNLWVAADGSAGYEAFSSLFELAPALDGDGLSMIIHASEDDHRSQPIGGAGARVACGVVEAAGS